MIGEQKTFKNKTLGEIWGVPAVDKKTQNCLYCGGILVAPMEDQKVELPILRRDSRGSNERPKSGIANTTARLWWLQ